MGDVANTLIGALAGPSPRGTGPTDVLAGMGGFAGPIGGDINPLSKMIGNMEGDPLPVDMAPGNPQEEAIAVRGWKPKNVSFLGALADQFLISRGQKPVFGPRMQNRNVEDAMEGFTQDPLETIRKLGQIPGMQGKALELYERHVDNMRQQGSADDLALNRQEKYLTRIGGMLNTVRNSKDPQTAYRNVLPTIRRYAEARGIDVSDLGEEYDMGAIENFIMGSVSPEDQLRMEATDSYRRERLDLDRQKANDLRYYRGERLEDFDNAEQGRDGRSNRGRNPNAGKAFKDSNGSLVEWNKSGDGIRVTEPNGRVSLYKEDPNGKRIRVWSGSKEEYAELTRKK